MGARSTDRGRPRRLDIRLKVRPGGQPDYPYVVFLIDGVFDDHPIASQEPLPSSGAALGVPDVAFEARQYDPEVRRATADRSWESPRRLTARLLAETLDTEREHLARLGWQPSFAQPWLRAPEPGWYEVIMHKDGNDYEFILQGGDGPPQEQASRMAGRLLSTPPEQWPTRPPRAGRR